MSEDRKASVLELVNAGWVGGGQGWGEAVVVVCGVTGLLFGQSSCSLSLSYLISKMSLISLVPRSALVSSAVSIVNVFGRDLALGSNDL